MRRESPDGDPAFLPTEDDGEATRTWLEGVPGRPPPTVKSAEPTDQAGAVVRYGPGVPATQPAGQAELTAKRVWRGGVPARPSQRSTRLSRLRRLFGAALTVILLAASGVVLYLRFHHGPFHVTGVAISQRTPTGCGVDVTVQITTNGSAGTVSYKWLIRPGQQPPRPLSQSAVAGQHAVYVSVVVEGQGHGSARRTVTLQVLGPDPRAISAPVVVSCR
jgi:hypothetical protein